MAISNRSTGLSPKDEENFKVLKNNLQNPADITEAVPPEPTGVPEDDDYVIGVEKAFANGKGTFPIQTILNWTPEQIHNYNMIVGSDLKDSADMFTENYNIISDVDADIKAQAKANTLEKDLRRYQMWWNMGYFGDDDTPRELSQMYGVDISEMPAFRDWDKDKVYQEELEKLDQQRMDSLLISDEARELMMEDVPDEVTGEQSGWMKVIKDQWKAAGLYGEELRVAVANRKGTGRDSTVEGSTKLEYLKSQREALNVGTGSPVFLFRAGIHALSAALTLGWKPETVECWGEERDNADIATIKKSSDQQKNKAISDVAFGSLIQLKTNSPQFYDVIMDLAKGDEVVAQTILYTSQYNNSEDFRTSIDFMNAEIDQASQLQIQSIINEPGSVGKQIVKALEFWGKDMILGGWTGAALLLDDDISIKSFQDDWDNHGAKWWNYDEIRKHDHSVASVVGLKGTALGAAMDFSIMFIGDPAVWLFTPAVGGRLGAKGALYASKQGITSFTKSWAGKAIGTDTWNVIAHATPWADNIASGAIAGGAKAGEIIKGTDVIAYNQSLSGFSIPNRGKLISQVERDLARGLKGPDDKFFNLYRESLLRGDRPFNFYKNSYVLAKYATRRRQVLRWAKEPDNINNREAFKQLLTESATSTKLSVSREMSIKNIEELVAGWIGSSGIKTSAGRKLFDEFQVQINNVLMDVQQYGTGVYGKSQEALLVDLVNASDELQLIENVFNYGLRDITPNLGASVSEGSNRLRNLTNLDDLPHVDKLWDTHNNVLNRSSIEQVLEKNKAKLPSLSGQMKEKQEAYIAALQKLLSQEEITKTKTPIDLRKHTDEDMGWFPVHNNTDHIDIDFFTKLIDDATEIGNLSESALARTTAGGDVLKVKLQDLANDWEKTKTKSLIGSRERDLPALDKKVRDVWNQANVRMRNAAIRLQKELAKNVRNEIWNLTIELQKQLVYELGWHTSKAYRPGVFTLSKDGRSAKRMTKVDKDLSDKIGWEVGKDLNDLTKPEWKRLFDLTKSDANTKYVAIDNSFTLKYKKVKGVDVPVGIEEINWANLKLMGATGSNLDAASYLLRGQITGISGKLLGKDLNIFDYIKGQQGLKLDDLGFDLHRSFREEMANSGHYPEITGIDDAENIMKIKKVFEDNYAANITKNQLVNGTMPVSPLEFLLLDAVSKDVKVSRLWRRMQASKFHQSATRLNAMWAFEKVARPSTAIVAGLDEWLFYNSIFGWKPSMKSTWGNMKINWMKSQIDKQFGGDIIAAMDDPLMGPKIEAWVEKSYKDLQQIPIEISKRYQMGLDMGKEIQLLRSGDPGYWNFALAHVNSILDDYGFRVFAQEYKRVTTGGKKLKPNMGTLEVSTKGDDFGKQFSALNATFSKGKYKGRTIEDVWQNEIKKSGKGQGPGEGSILRKDDYAQSKAEYQKLWEEWLDQNPKLKKELQEKLDEGYRLKDSFAKGDPEITVNQAEALTKALLGDDIYESVKLEDVQLAINPSTNTTYKPMPMEEVIKGGDHHGYSTVDLNTWEASYGGANIGPKEPFVRTGMLRPADETWANAKPGNVIESMNKAGDRQRIRLTKNPVLLEGDWAVDTTTLGKVSRQTGYTEDYIKKNLQGDRYFFEYNTLPYDPKARFEGTEAFKAWFQSSDANYLRGTRLIDDENPVHGLQTSTDAWALMEGTKKWYTFHLSETNAEKVWNGLIEAAIKRATGDAKALPSASVLGKIAVPGVRHNPGAGPQWFKSLTGRRGKDTTIMQRMFGDPAWNRTNMMSNKFYAVEKARLEELYKSQGKTIHRYEDLGIDDFDSIAISDPQYTSDLYGASLMDEQLWNQGMVTENYINARAMEFAQKEIDDFMLKFHMSNGLADDIRFVAPFGKPWIDFFSRYMKDLGGRAQLRGSHWAYKNPENAVDKVKQAWGRFATHPYTQNVTGLLPNPRRAAYISRIAGADMSGTNYIPGIEGSGDRNVDFQRLTFLPNGDNAMFAINPLGGIVPMMMLGVMLEYCHESKLDECALLIENLFPGVEFMPSWEQYKEDTPGAITDALLGGGVVRSLAQTSVLPWQALQSATRGPSIIEDPRQSMKNARDENAYYYDNIDVLLPQYQGLETMQEVENLINTHGGLAQSQAILGHLTETVGSIGSPVPIDWTMGYIDNAKDWIEIAKKIGVWDEIKESNPAEDAQIAFAAYEKNPNDPDLQELMMKEVRDWYYSNTDTIEGQARKILLQMNHPQFIALTTSGYAVTYLGSKHLYKEGETGKRYDAGDIFRANWTEEPNINEWNQWLQDEWIMPALPHHKLREIIYRNENIDIQAVDLIWKRMVELENQSEVDRLIRKYGEDQAAIIVADKSLWEKSRYEPIDPNLTNLEDMSERMYRARFNYDELGPEVVLLLEELVKRNGGGENIDFDEDRVRGKYLGQYLNGVKRITLSSPLHMFTGDPGDQRLLEGVRRFQGLYKQKVFWDDDVSDPDDLEPLNIFLNKLLSYEQLVKQDDPRSEELAKNVGKDLIENFIILNHMVDSVGAFGGNNVVSAEAWWNYYVKPTIGLDLEWEAPVPAEGDIVTKTIYTTGLNGDEVDNVFQTIQSTKPSSSMKIEVNTIDVIDGDTLKNLSKTTKEEDIRIVGIMAQEINLDPSGPYQQWRQEAELQKIFLQELVNVYGDRLHIVFDNRFGNREHRDPHKRRVGWLWVEHGIDNDLGAGNGEYIFFIDHFSPADDYHARGSKRGLTSPFTDYEETMTDRFENYSLERIRAKLGEEVEE